MSALGLTIREIVNAVRPQADNVQVSLIGTNEQENSLVIFASNLGEQSAALKSCWIARPAKSTIRTTSPGWELASPTDPVIAAGTSRAIALRSMDEIIPAEASRFESAEEYTIVLELIRFDGSLREIRLPYKVKSGVIGK